MTENLKFLDADALREISDNYRTGFALCMTELFDTACGGATFMDFIQLRHEWVPELERRKFEVKLLQHFNKEWGAYRVSWFFGEKK